ncbi:carboxymuconolactone decarboxylase family protein [Oceanidesulfovibrio marinus]|uniref:Carboxymuconolactone decarboxylase family protein n=1 Tax=Oceanidesulfovibrio marinus TaxID=370038 RepID=A0A6P1ZH65_9BACT|nr:carboxymuconolactone decarboxylase family protein [Oceanidesulfovibrio marinus]QJT09383.1 carboxymuconolactone decarboxylase family protein [Oceanidesulfovibrio marinus]TVM32876.1 carboxymuconolactone decarboxylase family protein [Oceanidesulfovibrio marinus]
MDKKPSHFTRMMEKYPRYMKAHEDLGKAVKESGPLDEVTLNLVQLAAAVAAGSEGAVHSHTRRARGLGVSEEAICHAILACTSTVGFPAVSAALSWVGHPSEEED